MTASRLLWNAGRCVRDRRLGIDFVILASNCNTTQPKWRLFSVGHDHKLIWEPIEVMVYFQRVKRRNCSAYHRQCVTEMMRVGIASTHNQPANCPTFREKRNKAVPKRFL